MKRRKQHKALAAPCQVFFIEVEISRLTSLGRLLEISRVFLGLDKRPASFSVDQFSVTALSIKISRRSRFLIYFAIFLRLCLSNFSGCSVLSLSVFQNFAFVGHRQK